MSRHTPGPWRVGHYNRVYSEQLEAVIADVWTEATVDDGQYKANARLISAAPELLEACEATLVDLRVARILSEKGFEKTIKRLEAAIARAEAQSE